MIALVIHDDFVEYLPVNRKQATEITALRSGIDLIPLEFAAYTVPEDPLTEIAIMFNELLERLELTPAKPTRCCMLECHYNW